VATLAYFCHRPLVYIVIPENLRRERGSEIDFATSAGRETQRERKLSGWQKSVEEIPSQRGKIIIIAIKLDFMGIIIIITITITITFIATITTLSRCNILG
jgi:uncharacterized membrane protein YdbT with pleckstrin-like domain